MSTGSVSGFTGSSTFAVDLQNAVTRAVSIASLPIQQLTASKNTIDNQATEIGQFGSLFSALQGAVQSIGSASGSAAFTATVSNPSVAQASITGSSFAGTYSVEVLDPGASSSSMSLALPTPVNDPSGQSISQSNSFTLTVDGVTYTINPTSQTLNGLADSINSSGAPVQALVINLGSPTQPDYRLIVQSTALRDVAIQLNDGSNDLVDVLTTGSNATYTVNGQPPGGISSDSRTVTIAPGLNVSLDSAGTTNITVGRSNSTIADSLSSFVDAYNAVVTELGKNHGQSGGSLTANSSVLTMESALRQLINYPGSAGSITSLTDLGITFTHDGTLAFDSSKLTSFTQSQLNDTAAFLGSPFTDGFLKFASDTLSSINDPITGVLASELQSLQAQSRREQQAINEAQDRVNQLQANLLAQMAAADALIATLQQQGKYLQSLFDATNNAINGRNQ